jgi:hypothetical protein
MLAAASPADLFAARSQMALSLGWHIVVACLGVGIPALVLLAEWRGIRTACPRGGSPAARRSGPRRVSSHAWEKARIASVPALVAWMPQMIRSGGR